MQNSKKFLSSFCAALLIAGGLSAEAQTRVRGTSSSSSRVQGTSSRVQGTSSSQRGGSSSNYRPQVSVPTRVQGRSNSGGSSRPVYTAPAARQNSGSSSRVSGYRPSNGSYSPTTRSYSAPSNTSTLRVTGAPSGATYPGRVSTSTARTYTPGYSNAVPGTFNGGSRNGVRVAPTNPTFSDSTRVTGYSPRGNTNTGSGYHPNTPNGPVYVNGNNGYRNNGYYNNGYRNNGYYSNNVRQNCAPRYSNYYDPYLYSDYNCRRGYRYYNNYYSVPFLSLGYFVARPYNYYNYASIDYAQPFVYGEDVDYRQAAPAVQEVASVQQTAAPSSLEQDLLNELARYVNANSKNDRFQIADPAFGDQVWSLDLTQAPAVYSIDTNHYSVVAGFEGTLGANTIPSSVGLEFFVAREASKWSIKKAWIVSANGIPRAKRFRSPAYPQVQTWQAGQSCPFSGQPMVPITDATTP